MTAVTIHACKWVLMENGPRIATSVAAAARTPTYDHDIQ